MEKEIFKHKLFDQACLRISDRWFPGCVIGDRSEKRRAVDRSGGAFTYESDSQAVTEDSIYDMASVTKAIPTACLLLKLIDDGKIDPDEPIAKYIPELEIRERNNILVQHLLEFTLDYSNTEYSWLGINTSPQTRF